MTPVDDFVELLFLDEARRMEMALPHAGNNKNMFFMLLQILMRALRKVTGAADLDSVTTEGLERVQRRLRTVGVVADIDIRQLPPVGVNGTNVELLHLAPADLPLSQYKFVVTDGVRGVQYSASFRLDRVAAGPRCSRAAATRT